MKDLKYGIYEEVINTELLHILNQYNNKNIEKKDIDYAESSLILANYLHNIIRNGLEYITSNDNDSSNIDKKVEIVNKIINLLAQYTDKDYVSSVIENPAQQLLALYNNKNETHSINEKISIERPETSLCQSSLFTGAKEEPKLFSEIKKEIMSCHQVDMLVSFIKHGGLMLIYDTLEKFTINGGKIRIITTTYMQATDSKAITMLQKLNNVEIKINYNTDKTRLHAKAYIFHRDTGFSTAYIGSSNMSRPAMTEGLEWNIKITQKDMPDTMERVKQTFDSYWEDKEFIFYENSQENKLNEILNKNNKKENYSFYFNVEPYPFQTEILESLKAERVIRNNYKNLVVAATGTGKTVISAFDYKNFTQTNKGPNRLLFIAHREEIL